MSGVTTEGYYVSLTVPMAGVSLGLLLALLGFSLVCWFCPRVRPTWRRTGAQPRAGDGGGPQRAPIEGSGEPA
eukprot:168103-Pyramimonas_sp.AAC.1